MKRVLFVAVALLMVAVGCKNRDKEPISTPATILQVETTELSINHESQKVDIEVVCNVDVDVEIEADWLRVYNIRDVEGGAVVVLSIQENDNAEARSAEVVIVAGELRHSVVITQCGAVNTSMEVVIGHRNLILASPKWGGEAVSGSINWGDNTTEDYSEGITHEYSDSNTHTATFTMSGATSFEIEKIGDMDSLTIAVD